MKTVQHPNEWFTEPPVNDLLNDPIAELLMQKDGVSRDGLNPILDRITEAMQQDKS